MELIKKNQYLNWFILFIISLGSIVIGIYRDGFAVLFPFLQQDMNLTRTQLSLYISIVYFSASFFSIFSGQLVDSIGSKRGLSLGVMLVGISLFLHSIFSSYTILLILGFFSGFGLSLNLPAANKGISEQFQQEFSSIATGIWSMAFPIGGLIAAGTLPFLSTLFGWRKAILLPVILSLLSIYTILTIFHDNKEHKKNNIQKITIPYGNFSQLVSNIDLLVLSVYGFFLGAMGGVITTHFTLFLYLDFNLTESIAGIGFAIAHIGSILSRPLWGLVCDKFINGNNRKTFLLISLLFFFVTTSFFFFQTFINNSLKIILLLSFITGCSGRGWQGLFYSSVARISKTEQLGVSIGFASLFNRVGTLLIPPIFGFIADLRDSYDFSWLFLGFMILIASFGQYFHYNKNTTKPF